MKRWLPGLIAVSLFIGGGLPVLFAQVGRAGADLYFPPELDAQTSKETISPEVMVTRVPFLPMIFFDGPGDASLPKRYQSRWALRYFPGWQVRFEHGLHVNIDRPETLLDPYYEGLKVLALRLERLDSAVITLTGRYSDEPGETPDIARQRALAVRDFLMQTASLDSGRIQINPPRPHLPHSNAMISDISAFREEGRRVDIASSDPEMFDDLVVYLRMLTVETLWFRFTLTHYLDPSMIRSVEFDSYLDNEEIGRQTWYPEEEGEVYAFEGEWTIPRRLLLRYPQSLIIRATIHMEDNSTRTASPLIVPVELSDDRYAMEWRVPADQRPEGSDDMSLGTLFFEMGGTDIPTTHGLQAEDILQRTPLGPLHLLVYHPVDPAGTNGELFPNERPSIVIQEDNTPEQVTYTCGFGMTLPDYRAYSGGRIGYREGGISAEESSAPADVISLAQVRTDVITSVLRRRIAARTADSVFILNPRRIARVETRIQTMQNLYPADRPEGRFYRRAVRVALQY